MAGDTWLIGVYYGGLVTIDEYYRTNFWRKLPTLRRSSFFEHVSSRQCLRPYFFFVEPFAGAKPLRPFNPSDYGLSESDFAHKSFKCFKLAARGEGSGDSFVVRSVPKHIVSGLMGQREPVCVLSLVDWLDGRARTGTFFRYELIEDGARTNIRFTPLMHRGKYLVGKGVLLGAFPTEVDGVMDVCEYEKEKECPVTIGSSIFEREGNDCYFVYREVETDLRLDMPSVFLYLAKIRGFKLLARNLGESLNKSFGICLGGILKRNILADGTIVDYADINTVGRFHFDIRTDCHRLELLVGSVFTILYLSAVAVDYYGKGLLTVLSARKERTEELRKFNQKNFRQINGRYQALCREFLGGLDKQNRVYFNGKSGMGIPSLMDMQVLFDSVLSQCKKK